MADTLDGPRRIVAEYQTVLDFQEMLVSYVTGGEVQAPEYGETRRALLDDAELRPLVPEFIQSCRTLDAFWAWMKQRTATYAERRVFLRTAFQPILDHLEYAKTGPADSIISGVLDSLGVEHVQSDWKKALLRRESDPEGAITTTRTLLESVCKYILSDWGVECGDKDDLPKLYGVVAENLKLAPDQHTEPVFKQILGNCFNLVNNLGTLRNRVGDAHGKRRPVKVSARHASLAVNIGGAAAAFLTQTHLERKSQVEERAQQLRQRLKISEVVGDHVALIKAGKEWKGCSPFVSETTPSFYVNDAKGFYHCFATGAHGDVVDFVMKIRNISKLKAVHELSKYIKVE